jgi:hypothetical protein
MSFTALALMSVVFAIATFFILNAQKARAMGLPQILDFALKTKATEVTLQVGERVEFATPAGPRTLFGSTLKPGDYERLVLVRLGALAREELRVKGRCEWRFDEKGVGRIVADVEPARARLALPRTAPNA